MIKKEEEIAHYVCYVCKKTFYNANALQNHKKMQHSSNNAGLEDKILFKSEQVKMTVALTEQGMTVVALLSNRLQYPVRFFLVSIFFETQFLTPAKFPRRLFLVLSNFKRRGKTV